MYNPEQAKDKRNISWNMQKMFMYFPFQSEETSNVSA